MKDIILHIDDERGNLDSFQILFWDSFEILSASNIKEAEGILKDFDVKLVIVDLVMPDESGIEFINRIKLTYPDLEFILTTSYTSLGGQIPEEGKDSYKFVEKPWNDKELFIAIKELLKKNSNNKNIKTSQSYSKRSTEIVMALDSKAKIIKLIRNGNEVSDSESQKFSKMHSCQLLSCIHFEEGTRKSDCEKCFVQNTINEALRFQKDIHSKEGGIMQWNNGIVKEMDICLSAFYLDKELLMAVVNYNCN